MNTNDHFEHRVKTSLDTSVQGIDAETRQQLASMRRNALNQPIKTSWFKREYWLPASSLALCSLLAMFLLVNPEPHNNPGNIAQNQAALQKPDDQVAVLELLNSGDDLDVVSDPDFYLWADEVLSEENPGYAA